MEKTSKGVGAALIVALLVVVGATSYSLGGNSTSVDTDAIAKEVLDKVEAGVEDRFGAFPSTNIISDFLVFNGIQKNYRAQSSLRFATGTACSLRTPLDASSTLVFAGVSLQKGTTTVLDVYIAKAVNNTSTTTLLGQAVIASGAKGIVMATGTPVDALDEDIVFAPGDYVNFDFKGSADGNGPFRSNDSLLGSCVLETVRI